MSVSLYDVASRESQVRPDERRAHERIAGRIVLRVGTRRAANKGLVHNLSVGGIGVYTRVVYPPGTLVAMALEAETQSGSEIALAGEVRWTRIVSGNPPEAVYEMGIRLMEAPVPYLRFYASLSGGPVPDAPERAVQTPAEPAPPMVQSAERRDDPRHAMALPVEFVEPADVAATLTRNIAGGGAFIALADGLEVGTIAVVDVRLPHIPEPVRALGRVCHVRPSSGPGDPGGVGLRFLRFFAGSEDRLRSYLDGLRDSLGVSEVTVIQGSETRPN